jgi:hypothetical protein
VDEERGQVCLLFDGHVQGGEVKGNNLEGVQSRRRNLASSRELGVDLQPVAIELDRPLDPIGEPSGHDALVSLLQGPDRRASS